MEKSLPGVQHQTDAPGGEHPNRPEVAGPGDCPGGDQEGVDDNEDDDVRAEIATILKPLADSVPLRHRPDTWRHRRTGGLFQGFHGRLLSRGRPTSPSPERRVARHLYCRPRRARAPEPNVPTRSGLST